jgi:hypothetical protein
MAPSNWGNIASEWNTTRSPARYRWSGSVRLPSLLALCHLEPKLDQTAEGFGFAGEPILKPIFIHCFCKLRGQADLFPDGGG